MRIGNLGGRPVVLGADGAADIVDASGGRFPTAAAILDQWSEFRAWADTHAFDYRPYHPTDLGAPVPQPRQVVGVGLNYLSHLREAGRAETAEQARAEILPLTFTKFPSSLAGPNDAVLLHGDQVDWEIELVAVLGATADNVPAADALTYVAGYLIGQDISDRAVQRSGQLSLGKSFRTYAPTGPWLVTADEIPDPQALSMRCWVGGELMQDASTADMLYSVAEQIALISAIFPLTPGDLLFTGTAAGVGVFRDPPRYLRPGDAIRSAIAPLGEMTNVCTSAPAPVDELGRRWHEPKGGAR